MNLRTILILSMLFFGCAKEEEAKTVDKYVNCTKAQEGKGQCIRWMDRTIYFAYSSASDSNRNNEFQKAKVQEALNEIQEITMLGPGYFEYKEVDESLLNPLIEDNLAEAEYKSFILIWPDSVFNSFITSELGGNTPDPNGLAVINAAFKRKFYMILRASCFVSSADCNGITTTGLRALVARQLGFVTGLQPKSETYCNTYPQNVMCTDFPEDAQWDEVNKLRYASALNNILETILNNPNFYEEYVPGS